MRALDRLAGAIVIASLLLGGAAHAQNASGYDALVREVASVYRTSRSEVAPVLEGLLNSLEERGVVENVS